MNAIMPPEDKLTLARKRSLRLIRKADDPNILLLENGFGISRDEILPDVKVIYMNNSGLAVMFSVWTDKEEINDISGSEPIGLGKPAMLILHESDIDRLRKLGVSLDTTSMSRSPSYSIWYFKLFDFISNEHVVHVLKSIVRDAGEYTKSA